ncbi:MAG: O-antigen ligase family protein [Candidatus Uhrbacteria bacterium]
MRAPKLDRILRILLALPLVFPLLFALGLVVSRTTEFALFSELLSSHYLRTLAFQALVTASWIVFTILVARGRQTLRHTRTHAWLLLLGICVIGMTVFSRSPIMSIFADTERADGTLFLVHLGLYIYLLSQTIRTREQFERLLLITVCAGLGMLPIMMMTESFTPFMSLEHPSTWIHLCTLMFGNPNFFAHYLLLLSIANTYFLIAHQNTVHTDAPANRHHLPLTRNRHLADAITQQLTNAYARYYRFVHGSIALILFVFIYTSRSHGAILFCLALLYALLFVAARKFTLFLTLSIILVTLFLVLIGARSSIPLSLIDSLGVRWHLWSDGVATMLHSSPLRGFGWSNVELMWRNATQDIFAISYAARGQSWYDRMHNDALEWFVAGGVFALLIYLAFWGRMIWASFRRAIHSRGRIWWFFTAAFLIQFIYTLANFETLVSYIILAVLIAGFIMAETHSSKPTTPSPHQRRRSLAIETVALLLVIGIIPLTIQPARAAWLKTHAEQVLLHSLYTGENRSADILRLLDRSIAIRQPNILVHRDALDIYILLASRVPLSEDDIAHIRTTTDAIFEQITQRFPLHATLFQRWAWAAIQLGDRDGEIEHLERAVSLAPINGTLRLQLASVLLVVNRTEEAKTHFAYMDEHGLFQGSPKFTLALIDFSEGNIAEGRRKATAALGNYHPTENDWRLATTSQLISTDRRDVLEWYQRLIGIAGTPPDIALYREAFFLAAKLGDTETLETLRLALERRTGKHVQLDPKTLPTPDE